jgi:hypothetical protein
VPDCREKRAPAYCSVMGSQHDYSPDAVAKAIGIESLADDTNLRADQAIRVLFTPSFHPECALTAMRSGAQTSVVLNTAQTNLWAWWASEERQRIVEQPSVADDRPVAPSLWREEAKTSDVEGGDFWRAIEALGPGSLASSESHGVDGMRAHYVYRDAGAATRFEAWNPQPPSPHYRLAAAVWNLGNAVLSDTRSIRLLEQLHRYLGLGPPIKVALGDPVHVRLFGGLSSDDEHALQSTLGAVAADAAVVVDMTNCDGMGTLLYPLFTGFGGRSAPTAWAASLAAAHHLHAAGIPDASIVEHVTDAEELVRANR